MARRNRENRENSPDKELIEQHVPTVSQAVRASGVLMGADRAAQEYAEHVIRAEVEAYCDGEGAYGDALRAVALGTESEGSAIAMVVATCTRRIAVYITTRLEDL